VTCVTAIYSALVEFSTTVYWRLLYQVTALSLNICVSSSGSFGVNVVPQSMLQWPYSGSPLLLHSKHASLLSIR
jgi:hypothetical protein